MGYDQFGNHNRKLDILLIENDPAMALLTKEEFREAGLLDRISIAKKGDEALAKYARLTNFTPTATYANRITWMNSSTSFKSALPSGAPSPSCPKNRKTAKGHAPFMMGTDSGK